MIFLKKYYPALVLSCVLGALFYTNYLPNTWLTGWDNLHPEFNFKINILNNVFGVWQQYQGLGLLAGMAHASELPHQLFLWIISHLFPIPSLRYIYHFLMLSLGTLSLYKLAKKVTGSKFASLTSSLYYLLNFHSVQYFSVPFEPYSTFWGFFPILLLTTITLWEKFNKKNLFLFFLLSLASTPLAYVQTIFAVYIISIFLVVLFLFLNKRSLANLKQAFLIFFVIFIANSYWLLPNMFFTITSVKTTQNAMMNLMVSDHFFEQNQYRGSPISFIKKIGPYYDTIIKNENQKEIHIQEIWEPLVATPYYTIVCLFLFLITLLGITQKNKYRSVILSIFLFSCLGLLSSTIFFSQLNSLLRSIPILNQIFRNPFTKLVVPSMLSSSLFLAIGVKKLYSINLLKYLALTIPIYILWISFPAYLGNYFDYHMRQNIPKSYFELMNYFSKEPTNSRIFNLPQYSFWGWQNYSWGYVGSGFMWYGIGQPITDRAFDVWSSELENFYWQYKYSFNKNDPSLLDNLLIRYQIKYIILDKNLLFPDSQNSRKITLETEKFLSQSALFASATKTNFDNIEVYKLEYPNSDISTGDSLPTCLSSNKFSLTGTPFDCIVENKYNTNLITPFSNRPDQVIDPFFIEKVVNDHEWITCKTNGNTSIKLAARNQESSAFYSCPNTDDLQVGYLIRVKYKNILGNKPFLKIFSLDQNKIIIDSRILDNNPTSYFFIPPLDEFDFGLGINISSQSSSDRISSNEITKIDYAPISADFRSKFVAEIRPYKSTISPAQYQQLNHSLYKLSAMNLNGTIILGQSFSPSWLAFYFTGLRPNFLTSHVLVNNWANGWLLPSNLQSCQSDCPTIYFFFWPQLLEFLGFILIPFGLFFIFRLKTDSLQ